MNLHSFHSLVLTGLKNDLVHLVQSPLVLNLATKDGVLISLNLPIIILHASSLKWLQLPLTRAFWSSDAVI